MEEEFEPKKIERKEEVQEVQNEQKTKEEPKERKRNIGRIIFRFVWIIIVLFVIFETVIGVLDMQRLNEDKEPVWYFSTETKKDKDKTETTYNLGLYVIVKTVSGKETKMTLRPFFLK